MTTTLARTVIAAAVLLTGVSAASARPGQAYDNGTLRSQIDLNAPDGARAFWESTQRNGR
jgi:hypothetical protein